LFHGTGVVITDAGKRYLGSVLDTDDFVKRYVQDKVSFWVGEMEKLSEIAVSSVCGPHTCVSTSLVLYCTYACRAFLST